MEKNSKTIKLIKFEKESNKSIDLIIDVINILKRNNIKINYFFWDSKGDKKIIIKDVPYLRLYFGSLFIEGIKK